MHCITTNAVIGGGGGGGGCKIHQINCTAVQPLVFVSLSQAQSWLEQQRLGHRASAKAFPAAWAASASANVGVDVWLFVIMLDVKNVLLLCCVVLCTSDWKWKRIRLALIGGPGSQKGLFFSFFFWKGRGEWILFFSLSFFFFVRRGNMIGIQAGATLPVVPRSPASFFCYHIWQSLTFCSSD